MTTDLGTVTVEQWGQILGILTALLALLATFYKGTEYLIRRWKRIEYDKTIPIWSPEIQKFKAFLNKNAWKTVWFETVLDFSVGTKINHEIWEVCKDEFKGERLGEDLNRCRIPVIRVLDSGEYMWLDSFILAMKDPTRLAYSAGGTGVAHVPLRGYFEVEVRAHSGPSVEFTLRERERPHNW